MKRILILFLIVGATVACKKEKATMLNGDSLIGVWVYTGQEQSAQVYLKKNAFDADKTGVEFKEDGTLVQRHIAGFCGTPPVAYENYIGTWKKNPDGTYLVNYEDWSGSRTDNWQILSVKDGILKVVVNP